MASLDLFDRQPLLELRGIFPLEALRKLHRSAELCFAATAVDPYSQSVRLSALLDFGCTADDLLAPLAVPVAKQWISGLALLDDQCWVRKRYAPRHAPPRYQPNSWHQDGALGVRFPTEPGPMPPMTPLITCWLPLTACGADAPGLEFVRRPLDHLLHYTELGDAELRRRFADEDFQSLVLEAGDGLLFPNGTLHRTYVHAAMSQDRWSVEYRFAICRGS